MAKKKERIPGKNSPRKLCLACENGRHDLCSRNMADCECRCWRL